MSKVTSKLQVTIPKALAEQYGIKPGLDIEWIPAGDSIRVVPGPTKSVAEARKHRLRLFDEATARQADRKRTVRRHRASGDRGWKREDLYNRGRAG